MNEESVFATALEKNSPRERQAFLDEACAGNAELRAQVEELLRADADAGSFLEHSPADVDATVVSEPSSRDTLNSGNWFSRLPFLAPCDKPDRIGKLDVYEIIEVVGHGGMGAVLRAFDTKLSRVVAVKVMSPTLAANPTAVKRFMREATTAAAVHHDHVVTIHAVDDLHEPPYIVMEFIEGQTLQQKIEREGALELKHILRIGSQAAAGLAAAHKTGLIHRDVKPANILLENGVERVKITDFGLARAADDLQITQTGLIAGTPQYMSPEQAKGEPIDARSDLFSLGSVLYTMCTGRPAFRADNPVAVLRRVCDDTPRPIREVNPEIPEWLEAIVNKLLAKDPVNRFQSAAEVAELLGLHLAHVQNPAIAPRPMPVAASPRVPRATGLWRDGNLLVMHKHAPLPDICLKSNAKATRRLKCRLAWHHPALYFVLLFNPLIYIILARVLQKTATIFIPLSDEWFLRRRQRMTFAWGSVLGGVALLWATIATSGLSHVDRPLLIILASILMIGGIVLALLAGRLVWTRRLTDDYIWLSGVHPELLNRLEIWTSPPYGIPAPVSSVRSEKIAPIAAGYETSWAPPLWLWGTGLLLAVVAMLVAVLNVAFEFSPVAIAPILVILTFFLLAAVAFWAFSVELRRTHAIPRNTLDTKPRKFIDRDVLIEHPVLGALAIVMLVVSVSAATFMLAAAVYFAFARTTLVPISHPLISDSGSSAPGATAGSSSNPSTPAETKRTVEAPDPDVVQALRDVVTAKQRSFERIQARVATGAEAKTEEVLAQIETIEARIRLAEAEHQQAVVVSLLSDLVAQRQEERQLTALSVEKQAIPPALLDEADARLSAVKARLAEASNAAAGLSSHSAASPDSGWVQLFNGKDLTGWKTHSRQPRGWRVEKGILIGQTADATHLFTERNDFQDFQLHAEVQIDKTSNSGIYFRSPFDLKFLTNTYPPAYEVQIYNNDGPTSYDQYKTGSLHAILLFRDVLVKNDDWFTLDIEARGSHVKVQVNGVTTVDANLTHDPARKEPRGHFVLQAHKGTVRFRKIEIRDLSSAANAPAAAAPSSPSESPNPTVIAALRDLVAAKERSLKTAQGQFAAAVGTKLEVLAAEIDHIEARIKLAEAEQQKANLLALLKDLVALRQEERRLIAQVVEGGAATPDELNQSDARLADSQARLAAANSDKPTASGSP
jgi:serine/threonine protein kinase